MKKIFQIITAFAFVFLSVVFISAQERTIEKQEFEAARQKAADGLSGKTYRETSVSEVFSDGANASKSTKTIYETIPPDKHRSIYITETGKTERIQIGTMRYFRQNDGEWKEVTEKLGVGAGCGARIEEESYKITENVELNGKTADLYQMEKKLSGISCTNETGGDGVWRDEIWITKDGLFLKTESEQNRGDGKPFTRLTVVYEYDSNIKIEAPIINIPKQ